MSHQTATPQAAATAWTRLNQARLGALLCCLIFFFEGLLFIPYAGLQNDELLFAAAIYPPWGVSHLIRISGHTFPTMIMTYIGTTKAWVYRLCVFPFWPPSPWSVRIPVLIAGVAAVALIFALARRIAGLRAAMVTTALIATDVTFILTTCLDWGPVAVQHLLLLVGLLLLWRFHRTERLVWLALGFFAFGLGLWDKALFSWTLVGLAVAALAAIPGTLLSHLRPRKIAVAAAALLLGATPLLLYNRDNGLTTFRDNARLSAEGLSQKVLVLRHSLEGGALFRYVVRDDPPSVRPPLHNALERASVGLRELSGRPRAGLLGFACLLALVSLPWLWNTPARRVMIFSLVFCTVTWLQMALSQRGGAGAHHTVLLWPFPHIFAAAALAQLSRALPRFGLPVLALLTASMCGANVLVLNEHLAKLILNGNTTVWTDAITPLATHLRAHPIEHIYVMDWGMFDALRAIGQGSLKIEYGPDVWLRDTEKRLPPPRMARPDALFIGHVAGAEVDTGTLAALEAEGRKTGLNRVVDRVISDRMGRPVFEIYRFVSSPTPRTTTPSSRVSTSPAAR